MPENLTGGIYEGLCLTGPLDGERRASMKARLSTGTPGAPSFGYHHVRYAGTDGLGFWVPDNPPYNNEAFIVRTLASAYKPDRARQDPPAAAGNTEPRRTLEYLVRYSIGAEGPPLDTAAYEARIDEELNHMSATDFLRRISRAFTDNLKGTTS